MQFLVRYILLLLTQMSSFHLLLSQQQEIILRPKNAVFASFNGDAARVSLNYEREIFLKPSILMSVRAGVGWGDVSTIVNGNLVTTGSYLSIPQRVTVGFQGPKVFFEAGMGGSYISGNKTPGYVFYPIIAIRSFPLKPKRLMSRVFVQFPIQNQITPNIDFYPVGVNLGWTF